MSDPIAAGMATLAAMREQQMVDACRVVRPGEASQTPTLDADGNVVTTAAAPVYEGACTISTPSDSSPATVSEQSGVPNTRVLKVPHRAALRPGDLLTITDSTYSPGLVGDVFTVVGEEERSYATFRKYAVRGSSWLPTSSA